MDARGELEQRCTDRLAPTPRTLATWRTLVRLAIDNAAIREEQTATLTLGWPLLRTCARGSVGTWSAPDGWRTLRRSSS
jgi:hypothetical protein